MIPISARERHRLRWRHVRVKGEPLLLKGLFYGPGECRRMLWPDGHLSRHVQFHGALSDQMDLSAEWRLGEFKSCLRAVLWTLQQARCYAPGSRIPG